MKHDPAEFEQTLWQLYRRLLAEASLSSRLAGAARHNKVSPAVAAALTQNLRPGDCLGLAPGELTTRFLAGMPLAALRAAMESPSRSRNGWHYSTDAEQGVLPGSGSEQASLAVGTALAARLQATGLVTVLVVAKVPRSAHGLLAIPGWVEAAHAAVTLQLPLLFLSESIAGLADEPQHPGRAAPALPSIPVDRSDALALYRVLYESAARARTGGGPTWIDCRDVGRGQDGSGLESMEQGLRARGLFHKKKQDELRRGLEREFAHWPADPA